MSADHGETDARLAPRQARRGFLAGVTAAVTALPLLAWGRKADAQVYYDQHGQPVTLPPGTVVSPAAAPPGAVPPAYSQYGPAGVVGQTRRVARRSSRRTGRRAGVREDIRDEIDD